MAPATGEAAPSSHNGSTMEEPHAAPAQKVTVIDHAIARHAFTALRNRHTVQEQFRVFANQLIVLLALEATRTLPTRERLVETVSGPGVGQALGKTVVFLSLARHGLGLAHQVADFIPNVAIGTISVEPGGHGRDAESRLHLPNAPALNTGRVILFDPVVSTGLSATLALDLLHRSGASDIALISFLVSSVGLERLQAAGPDVTVWTAAIDSEWDPKKSSVSSLGDFAERLYG
jgi:uracil phosphoribosyltransferase